MDGLFWIYIAAIVGVVYALNDAGGQYDWYDTSKGSGGSASDGAGAAGGNGAASQVHPGGAVYSGAAETAPIGITDDFITQLLSQTSNDDGMTLDLFSKLAQYGSADQIQTGDEDDLIAQILATVANDGATAGGYPTAETPVQKTEPDMKQLQAASNIFTLAQGHASDADYALAKAQSDYRSAGTGDMVDAASSAKTAALGTIVSTKAEARSSVIHYRNAYITALGKLKDKVNHMRHVEKRFRALAVVFSKARDYAGQALLTLKSITSNKESSNGYHSYAHPKQDDVVTTVTSAKARITKMKIVEKQFLDLAKALAMIRAETYSDVRDVRKNAVRLAKITTAAQIQVGAAVDKATSIVSQAVATARATSLAKAEAEGHAAIAAKSKAEVVANAVAGLMNDVHANADAVSSQASPDPSASKVTDYSSAGYTSDQTGTSYGSAATAAQDSY